MNKKLLLAMTAILLLCTVFISWTQMHTATRIPPKSRALQATPAHTRAVQNIRVQNYRVLGEQLTYYTKVPQRVIAVGEQINETLVALGVADKVICPVRYGNPFYKPEPKYAAGYNSIKFQDFSILNMETVLSLEPDLIISGQSIYSDKRLKSTDFWNQRGINTYVSANANSPSSHDKKETLQQELDFILGLGKIFNKEQRAQQIVAEMQQPIALVREKTKGRPQPRVMIVELLGKSLIAYDDTKLAGDICKQLGAKVASFPGGTIGLETIVDENPDVLFVVKSGGDPEQAADFFRKYPGLQSLPVIKQGRVYGISLNYSYNSAIKTGEGIKKFAHGLYPDLF